MFLVNHINTGVKRDECGFEALNMRRRADAAITITMPGWLA
jgi:hypothetical protein